MPTVTLRTPEQEIVFSVPAGDSILEAALKAGIPLPYTCRQGLCGDCRARCLQGTLRKVSWQDFSFKAYEKVQGYFLTCTQGIDTDVVIESPLENQNAQSATPWQSNTARIKKIDHPHPDILTLQVQLPRQRPLEFLPGQSALLSLNNGFFTHVPIACCPCNGRTPEFHLYRHPHDMFSQMAFEHLKVGHTVKIEGPNGKGYLSDMPDAPIVLLCYGYGFSGIRSLLEHALAEDALAIHLYRFADDSAWHYQDTQCRAWADSFQHFHYHAITCPQDVLPQTIHRELSRLMDLPQSHVYVAGSALFLQYVYEGASTLLLSAARAQMLSI